MNVYHIEDALIATLKTSPNKAYRDMYQKAQENGWMYSLKDGAKMAKIYFGGEDSFILSTYRFNHRFASRVRQGKDQNMQMFKVNPKVYLTRPKLFNQNLQIVQ